MKYILLLVLAFPVSAADFQEKKDGSVIITMSKSEMIECSQKGGCVIIAKDDIVEIAKKAVVNMCGKNI